MSTNYRRDEEEEDYEMAGEEDEPEYEVEAILDKKKVGTKWKYLIKWVGYPSEQNTWEPEDNLNNVNDMLAEFEEEWNRKNKDKDKNSNIKPIPTGKPCLKVSSSTSKVTNPAPLKESKISTNRKREEDEDFDTKKLNKKRKLSEDEEDIRPLKTSNLGKSNAGAKSKKENSLGGSINNNSKPLTEMLKSKSKDTLKSSTQLNSPSTTNKKVLSDGAVYLHDDDSYKTPGSFDTDDIPKRLLTAKLHTDTNEVKCLVEWEMRKSGVKPEDSFVTNKLLRQRCPQLLLDFYESRLRFPTGK